MTHDVFISHSSKDRAVGEAACAALERAGHRCWIAPRDIMPGEDYGEAIVDGIRASRIFLLIVSRRRASPRPRSAARPSAPPMPASRSSRSGSRTCCRRRASNSSSARPTGSTRITRPMEPHYDYLVQVVGRLLAEADGQDRAADADARRRRADRAAAARRSVALHARPAIADRRRSLAGVARRRSRRVWRGLAAPAEPPRATVVTDVSRSIFTRRATTKDPNKPVRLRSAPSQDGPVIAVIGTDEVFRVAPRQGDWWPAQLANGTQGYVHAGLDQRHRRRRRRAARRPISSSRSAPAAAAPTDRAPPRRPTSNERQRRIAPRSAPRWTRCTR